MSKAKNVRLNWYLNKKAKQKNFELELYFGYFFDESFESQWKSNKKDNIFLELSKKLLSGPLLRRTLRYRTRTYLNRGPNQRPSSGAQDHDKNFLSFGFRFRNSVNECQVNSFLILAVLDWILKMKTKSHPKHSVLL